MFVNDELEPERQQTLEQQFRKMIYKRRMKEINVDNIDEYEMNESAEPSEKIIM